MKVVCGSVLTRDRGFWVGFLCAGSHTGEKVLGGLFVRRFSHVRKGVGWVDLLTVLRGFFSYY